MNPAPQVDPLAFPDDRAAARAGKSVTLILALIWPVLAIAVWTDVRQTGQPAGQSDFDAVRSTVDPNTAPWWELTILPGIGETKARDIVAYRNSLFEKPDGKVRKVFESALDLDKIPGIGPKTVARIYPELHFITAENP